jgi:hypothetical protein
MVVELSVNRAPKKSDFIEYKATLGRQNQL